MKFTEKFNETLKALQSKNAETKFERAIVAYYGGEIENLSNSDYWLPEDGNDTVLYHSIITSLTNWMLSILRHPTVRNHALDTEGDLKHVSYIASLIEAVNNELYLTMNNQV